MWCIVTHQCYAQNEFPVPPPPPHTLTLSFTHLSNTHTHTHTHTHAHTHTHTHTHTCIYTYHIAGSCTASHLMEPNICELFMLESLFICDIFPPLAWQAYLQQQRPMDQHIWHCPTASIRLEISTCRGRPSKNTESKNDSHMHGITNQ
jgi:hypothetical protein